MTTESPHLLDLNVLIALTWTQHVHHERAQQHFRGLGTVGWATTPMTEAGFVRLSTNARVVGRHVTVIEALGILRELRASSGHRFLPDASGLADPVIDLGRAVSTSQVTDLHLVNLAAASGAVLATLDRSIVSFLDPRDRGHVIVLR